MSATNRGAVRNERDFYATPESAFKPIIPFIGLCKPHHVWEPACGDRRLIRWLAESELRGFVDGDDLTNGYDFLKDMDRRYNCIVTNPPFSLAFEFCQHAVAVADHVFLLLRLNFLASAKRKPWFAENEPDALFILSKRPSFTEDGGTDACDYAWYYWGQRHHGIVHL